MSRPRKDRKICRLPKITSFSPTNDFVATDQNIVYLSVDEYEAIRLIDHEGLNQEECAIQMEIARTTAQKIYNEARRKLSVMLIEGTGLTIEGGSYMVCSESRPGRRCSRCIQSNDVVLEEHKEGHNNS